MNERKTVSNEKVLDTGNKTLTNTKSFDQQLTFNYLRMLLEQKDFVYYPETFDANNKLLTMDNEYNYNALLLSDQFPFSIKVVRFSGMDKQAPVLYRREYSKVSLLKIIDDVLGYIDTNVNGQITYFDKNMKRKTEYYLDKAAVREAWVNACCHNDYTTHIAPGVFVFNDRIEFFSYGSPLKHVTEEQFYAGVSRPANPELALIMTKLGIIQQNGHGINTILKNYKKYVFKFSDDYFQVVFKFKQ